MSLAAFVPRRDSLTDRGLPGPQETVGVLQFLPTVLLPDCPGRPSSLPAAPPSTSVPPWVPRLSPGSVFPAPVSGPAPAHPVTEREGGVRGVICGGRVCLLGPPTATPNYPQNPLPVDSAGARPLLRPPPLPGASGFLRGSWTESPEPGHPGKEKTCWSRCPAGHSLGACPGPPPARSGLRLRPLRREDVQGVEGERTGAGWGSFGGLL